MLCYYLFLMYQLIGLPYFFTGEIFGGIFVGSDRNDTEILMQLLGQCCLCLSNEHSGNQGSCEGGRDSVPQLLSRIKGPWAVIYWQVNPSGKFLFFFS